MKANADEGEPSITDRTLAKKNKKKTNSTGKLGKMMIPIRWKANRIAFDEMISIWKPKKKQTEGERSAALARDKCARFSFVSS